MPRTPRAEKAYSSSYSCSSSSGEYDDTDDDENSSADLFKEAEEMIKNKLSQLFSVGSTCGVKTDRRGSNIFDPDDEPVRPPGDKTPANPSGTGGSSSYHVHKAVLVHGPRSSQFFVRQFEDLHKVGESYRRDAASSGAGGKAAKMTEVALPKRSASLVPMLLDFIYDDKLELKSSNAPPIRHLANHFDVRQLHTLVSSFIQNDLTVSTAAMYMSQADLVKDKELLQMAMDVAAQCLPQIEENALIGIPPHVLPQVLSHPKAIYPSSEWLSTLVGRYIRGRRRLQKQQRSKRQRQEQQRQLQQQNKGKRGAPPPLPQPEAPMEEITDETFYFLTHAQILPKIAPCEAIWYLTFAKEAYGADVLLDESMGGKEGSLRRRCIVAVGRDWRGMLLGPLRADRADNTVVSGSASDTIRRRLFVEGEEEGDAQSLKIYKALPIDIRVEILEESLINAAEGGPPQVLSSDVDVSMSMSSRIEGRGDFERPRRDHQHTGMRDINEVRTDHNGGGAELRFKTPDKPQHLHRELNDRGRRTFMV